MSYRTYGHTDRDLDIMTKKITLVQQTSPEQNTGRTSSPQSPKVLSENKEPPVQKSPLHSIGTEDLHQLTQPIRRPKNIQHRPDASKRLPYVHKKHV